MRRRHDIVIPSVDPRRRDASAIVLDVRARMTPTLPSIAFDGRVWPADEIAVIAGGWVDAAREAVPSGARVTAMLMSNHPETVALLFALSSLPWPLAVLPADPRAWRSTPPLPTGSPVFLAPPLRALAPACASAGLHAIAMDDARAAASGDLAPLACPGFVNFTSGSTGLPKPVSITTTSFLAQTDAVIRASGLVAGDSVVGSLQLSTHYGLGQALILSSVLGGRLGLIERFDHRALLRLLAMEPYTYWATTPLMADMLARAPLSGACPSAPRTCHVSAGRLSPRTFRQFSERFGVTLRPSYGQTENGFIAVDTGDENAIRADRVGRAAPGIEIRIGDDPREPARAGALGRVWFTSPWYMEGYGFPPEIAPRASVDDRWFPTADLGFLDDDGYLALAGRADDCFKTALGHLVNPGTIADAFSGHAGVADVVVLPIGDAGAAQIGVVVEADGLDPLALRAAAARALPPWLQPHAVAVVPALPRLAGGKADRDACRALLHHAGAVAPGA